MLKLMDKQIFTILRSKILFILTYAFWEEFTYICSLIVVVKTFHGVFIALCDVGLNKPNILA